MLFATNVESVSAAGDTVDIYVVTKIAGVSGYDSHQHNDLTVEYYDTGLVKKTDSESYNDDTGTGDWLYSNFKYAGTKIKRVDLEDKASSGYYKKYIYKNGKLAKVKCQWDSRYMLNDSGSYVEKYSYAGNKVKKITHIENGYKTVNKFSYDMKGRIKQVIESASGSKDSSKYTYDNKGNRKTEIRKYSQSSGYKSTTKVQYSNTYVNGRLSSVNITQNEKLSNTYQYEYKKMTVKKKYAKAVKKQQWELINEKYL